MELKERLKFCKICENIVFNSKTGINCALTQRKPRFYNTCPTFVEDISQLNTIQSEKIKKELSYSLPKGAVVATLLALLLMALKIIIKNFW